MKLTVVCVGMLVIFFSGVADSRSHVKDPLTNDTVVLELRTNKFQVPTDYMYYNCRYVKLDIPPVKHHLIKYEPVIQPGNEGVVHHANLFYCWLLGDSSEELNKDVNCNTLRQDNCKVLVIWSAGGKPFIYPAHVGLDVPLNNVSYRLEVHYYNRDRRPGIVDSSGLRLYLTTSTRRYDAQPLGIGGNNDEYLMVPPMAPNFVYRGHCDASCTNRALNSTDIHVFAVYLHGHAYCRGIKIRHFRNGGELPPIIEDRNYHFRNQSVRLLAEERTVTKGDNFIVECNYDTSEAKSFLYGGHMAVGENCVSFLQYYPKINWPGCSSGVYYHIDGRPVMSDIFKIVKTMNWTIPKVRADFQRVVSTSPFESLCIFNNLTFTNIIPVSNISDALVMDSR